MCFVPSHGSRLQGLPVPNAHLQRLGAFSDGQFPVWPDPMRFICMNAKGMPQEPGVVFALSHKQQVALHILFEDEQGFGFAAYLNPSALAYGISRRGAAAVAGARRLRLSASSA